MPSRWLRGSINRLRPEAEGFLSVLGSPAVLLHFLNEVPAVLAEGPILLNFAGATRGISFRDLV